MTRQMSGVRKRLATEWCDGRPAVRQDDATLLEVAAGALSVPPGDHGILRQSTRR